MASLGLFKYCFRPRRGILHSYLCGWCQLSWPFLVSKFLSSVLTRGQCWAEKNPQTHKTSIL